MCDHQHNLFWGAINDFLMSKNFSFFFRTNGSMGIITTPPATPFIFVSFLGALHSLSKRMYFLNGPSYYEN